MTQFTIAVRTLILASKMAPECSHRMTRFTGLEDGLKKG